MSSSKKVLIAVLSVVLVVVAIGLGWFAAVYLPGSHSSDEARPSSEVGSSAQPSDSEGTAAASKEPSEPGVRERCTASWVQRADGMEDMSAILYCDGDHVRAGVPNSDSLGLAVWKDNGWQKVAPSGRTFTGFNCYDENELDSLGFSDEAVGNLTLCGGPRPGVGGSDSLETVGLGQGPVAVISRPACDGRYILIHDSIIDDSVGDTGTKIAQSIDGHPDWKYTYPGQCSSLRAQVDVHDIYPVYEDFGPDLRAMCAAKAQTGGNGRTLNSQGDFSDPC